jgi:hypothetical protein
MVASRAIEKRNSLPAKATAALLICCGLKCPFMMQLFYLWIVVRKPVAAQRDSFIEEKDLSFIAIASVTFHHLSKK